MIKKITVQQLEQHLWNSANFLRNKIDAGDYKAYIFPLMFYKRICDEYDREFINAFDESDGDMGYARSAVNHQFQIPDKCHWNDLRKISRDIGQEISKSMRRIEKANPEILFGIFGDANWGNTERLSDETLKNLIEHFSILNLSTETVPDDLMGTAYEYLIKQFADDSGHTAAEFYTNRTVVSLMTELLDPQPNESIYDPTCGTGGMLLECVNYLKSRKIDHRALKLFGQEKNIITSGIARMNILLHGFEDSQIKRGDTLSVPLFLEEDSLQTFDVILANPPYSINRWNRKAWDDDPYGRNIYGVPPQSRADYVFIQHIVHSLSKNGRAAILLPHGVLFRDGEEHIRKKMIQDDKLEAVIGLPKDMFYNSIMESCILIFKTIKKQTRKKKLIFINAVNEFERKKNKNFLNKKHIKKISDIYDNFETISNFSYVANVEEIQSNNCLLSISKYVKQTTEKSYSDPEIASKDWFESHQNILQNTTKILRNV